MAALNIFTILILLGCLHGIILGVLSILFNKAAKPANLFLGGLLIAFSLNNINWVLFDLNIYNAYPQLYFIPISFLLTIGPLIYFYVRHLTYLPSTNLVYTYLHFMPAFFICLYYGYNFFKSSEEKKQVARESFFPLFSPLEQVLGLVSVFIYLYYSFTLIKLHEKWIIDHLSYKYQVSLAWLKNLLLLLAVAWIAWTLLLIVDITWFKYALPPSAYYPLHIGMSVIVYYIGYAGFLRPQIILVNYSNKSVLRVEKGIPVGSEEKYTPAFKEVMASPENENIELYRPAIAKLTLLMEVDKVYLDPDLSLNGLAASLDLHPKKLSYMLNSVLNKSFYDYINEYRVEEVKKRLIEGNDQLTLLGIALSCGFKSKSTFQLVFKQFTNMTPSEYKNKFSR